MCATKHNDAYERDKSGPYPRPLSVKILNVIITISTIAYLVVNCMGSTYYTAVIFLEILTILLVLPGISGLI